MSKRPESIKHRARHIIEPMQEELTRLRLMVEQLREQLGQQRKARIQLEEALAFERQHKAEFVRQRLNGGA